MESRFHQELEQLKMTILQMAALTERALEQAIKSLMERDVELANQVIEGDSEINLLEVDVDRHCLETARPRPADGTGPAVHYRQHENRGGPRARCGPGGQYRSAGPVF